MLWNDVTKLISNTQNVIHGSIGIMAHIASDPEFRAIPCPLSTTSTRELRDERSVR